MKIRKMELFKVPPRWLFLKVETDNGLTGWGEPIVEGKADTVRTAVEELGEYLLGKDPLCIEDHWQAMYRGGFYRGGPILMSAISGIEQALWDIKGKYYNAPVYDLIGGKTREKIQVYSWIGGDRPNQVAEAAKRQVAAGFAALKMNAVEEMNYIDSYKKIDQAVARIALVRETVGYNIGIGIDFHGRVHKGMAKMLAKELEPYKPMFIEEPVLAEHEEALRDLRRAVHIPIATGERLFSRWGFKKLVAEGLADIIQPDPCHAGGILETRKIAAMAEAYDIAAAFHCPLGPIALAVCLHLDACTPNALIQEQSLGIHYNQGADMPDYLRDASLFQFANGWAPIPNGPGLGVNIDEEKVRAAAKIGHQWRSPVWRNEDGSVAEW